MNKNKQTKSVFAAYLNMARQNAYTTLMHISTLMGVEEKRTTESGLYNFSIIKELGKKKGEAKSERIQKTIKLLHKHFPFLNAMIDSELRHPNGYVPTELEEDAKEYAAQLEQQTIQVVPPMTYYTIFEIVFKLLDSLRNEYTHYSPVCNEEDRKKVQKAMVGYLYKCLDGGRRVVKRRFEDVTEEDMTFLTGKPRYVYEYGMVKGRRCVTKTEERTDFRYRLKTSEGLLSDVGIILFTCLFLHKKYASQFIAQAHLFPTKNCPEMEQKIIREIFSVYRIRLPRERLESQHSEYALGMDMLNELQKCPKELYETLSDEKKKLFRIASGYDEQGEETDAGEVLLLRSGDRFPYFALRYIDENKLFQGIRFQVSLGNYRYKFYEKQCIDSREADRVRSLQKEINGFGRLNEIERRRRETWKEHIRTNDKVRKDEADTLPYITDHHASYVFNGNRVGLMFNNESRHDLKTANGESFYLPPLTFDSSCQGKDAVCLPPVCWLSVYELPALIFHQYLCKDNRTEKIIKECVANYHRLFKDIQEGNLSPETLFPSWERGRIYTGKKKNKRLTDEAMAHMESTLYGRYHIHGKDVPEKLIEYLSGSELFENASARFRKLAKEKLEKMLSGTEARLEIFEKERASIGQKDNKFGKKQYVDIRPGRLALYLAKDILFFQPANEANTNKVTGLNYQVLQSSLAIYDKSLKELRQLFVKANLLPADKSLAHPFLQKVLDKQPKNTLDFYQFYLQRKIEYLQKLVDDASLQPENIPFLHSARSKWQNRNKEYYKALAGRYLQESVICTSQHAGAEAENEAQTGARTYYKPIELPRGLFEEPIKELLRGQCGDIKEIAEATAPAPTGQWYNVTYLIALYFKHRLGDASQPFYDTEGGFKRTYKVFNLLRNQKVRNRLQPQFYALKEMEEKLQKDDTGENDVTRKTRKYLSAFRKNVDKEVEERKLNIDKTQMD